jgi:hypothetical protein
MGSFLVKLLTNPENFKFYSGNSEGQVGNVSSADNFGQKSISYGKDRPGGGSSSQPYIKGVGLTGTGTKTVGDAWGNFTDSWEKKSILTFGIGVNSGLGVWTNSLNQITSFGPLAGSLVYAADNLPNIPDSIIRGGTKSLSRSVIDATRLTKYFLDYKSVNGVLFIAKQNLLSRVSVKTEPARTGAAYLYGVLNGGLYTPLSTIGQAAAGFAGIHLNEKGIDPTGIIPQLSIRNYQKVAFDRNKGDISNENSKGYQRKVDKKINKIQKLKDQLKTSREQLQVAQNYDPNTDPQYNGEWSGQDGKTYPTQEEALKSVISAKRIGTNSYASSLFYLNTGKEFNLTNLTEEETKLLKQAKSEDQKIKNARDKAIKDDRDQEAFLTKQVKKLPEQILDNEEELEELTLGGKYKNRLLRLWDRFGLDINNPVESDATTLLKYGGGPGSILGIGKTKIKFATLNDGITPARTGYNMLDPYPSYLNNGPGRFNTFYDNKIYGVGPNGRLNSVFCKAGYSAEDYFGDSDYISKLSNSSKLLEDNSFILQPWAAQVVYATDPTEIKSINVSKKYSTWEPILFKQQLKNDVDHSTLDDFRRNLNISSSFTFLSLSPDYTIKNIEKRLGLGGKRGNGPGAPGKRTNYDLGKTGENGEYIGPLDIINALPIYRSGQADVASLDLIEDIIPFKISILDNNDPTKFFHVHLRAFIDDFSDSYSSQWKKIEYMGRGEKFYKYGGFDRDISIGFTVAAQSKEELIPIYRKLNFLASSLTPFYTEKGYMAGNIAYLTLGDYLTNQSGIINTMTIDIDKDSPWEIGIDTNGNRDENVPRLPFMVKVKMKFTPIHQFRPEINKLKNTPTPGSLTVNTIYPDKTTNFGNQRYISNIGPSGSHIGGFTEINPLYKGTDRPAVLPYYPPADLNNLIQYNEGDTIFVTDPTLLNGAFSDISNITSVFTTPGIIQDNPFGI